MDSASALISDAHTVLSAESCGRAKSLTVPAQEDLGKALWIYEASERPWSEGSGTPFTADALERQGRTHEEIHTSPRVR
ncbi:AbiV family abortive infection protein [Streptomyces sp. NPDC052077]